MATAATAQILDGVGGGDDYALASRASLISLSGARTEGRSAMLEELPRLGSQSLAAEFRHGLFVVASSGTAVGGAVGVLASLFIA